MRPRSVTAAIVASACCWVVQTAIAEPQWSIGAAYGGGSYENELFNSTLPQGFDGIHSGRDLGASLRCEISPHWALEVEAMSLKGADEKEGGTAHETLSVETEITAIPLNVIYRVAGTSTVAARIFAGGGLLTNAHWNIVLRQTTETIEQSSESVTRPYGQAGVEIGWHARPKLEFTGRALGRLAQANHVPGGALGEVVVDHTGFAVALGARFGLLL